MEDTQRARFHRPHTHRRLYLRATRRPAARTVFAFDVIPAKAGTRVQLTNKRLFVRFDDYVYPDGMAVDQTGNIWIALFGGWRVEIYSPYGAKLDEIRLPCANITKPAFGGPDLRTLYITSAWVGLTPEERQQQPLAGALFAVSVWESAVCQFTKHPESRVASANR